jgi:hypothetical protein
MGLNEAGVRGRRGNRAETCDRDRGVEGAGTSGAAERDRIVSRGGGRARGAVPETHAGREATIATVTQADERETGAS